MHRADAEVCPTKYDYPMEIKKEGSANCLMALPFSDFCTPVVVCNFDSVPDHNGCQLCMGNVKHLGNMTEAEAIYMML